MHHHISIFHPALVGSFEGGWESLSPSLKTSWLSHTFADDDKDRSETWVSWAYYAYRKMLEGDRKLKYKSLDCLAEHITHEGEIFGILREVDPVGEESHMGAEDQDCYEQGLMGLIVDRFSMHFQRRIRDECEQWLTNTLATAGVGVLKTLLEADSVLDVISNSKGQ
jgi:hypothetical protein